jgi:hypothetical protein
MPRLKNPFKKRQISAEEWARVREEAEAARELLEDPRFGFFRDYLQNVQSSITDLFVHNKIRPVQEHLKISDVLTKTFTTTRKEQEDELSGKYKLVEDLLADLRRIVELPKEYEEAQKAGKIEIEGDKEDA